MSIKYNGKIVAGNYKAQVVSDADTVNKGIVRIATQDEVNEALSNDTAVTPFYLSSKQNKLISGENISIQNDIINCDIIPDDLTIIQNDDKTFTSIGQKTPSNTIKIDWEGTSAEYETGIENGTIKADWFCYITDDEQVVEFDNTTDKYDLEASNIYTLGKYVMTDTEGYNILETEYLNPNSVKKVDILLEDKFTTVGIPVITEDRILVQTSENNYIYIDDLNFNNKDYYINTKLVLNNNVTSENVFYIKSKSRDNCIQCNIENNNIYIKALDEIGELVSEYIELQLNVNYNIQIGFTSDKNQLYLKVFDINNVLLKIASIQLNSYGMFFGEDNVTLYIGYDLQNYLNNISVDLNSFKVYVEETCIHRACLRMPYIYSTQNSKIVDYKYKDRILDWIELNNSSEYYIINTEDKTFILPNIQNPLSKIIYSSNKDLNNLTEEGEKHFINKSQITNCITEIPQRIKLELNDGTLILKAGSEVIIPNGFEEDGTTLKFDYVSIENDITVITATSAGHFVILYKDGNFRNQSVTTCFSGNTQPTVSSQYATWYDTTVNKVKLTNDNGATWISDWSLPFCLSTTNANGLESVDQIFNGIGYIGSIIWVDKGVKGLIPNGRNEDGTLKNIEHVTQKLITRDVTDNGSLELAINFYDSLNVYSYFTVSDENYLLGNNGAKVTGVSIVKIYMANGVITSFNPKQPFRAVDYNDYTDLKNTKVSKSGDTMTGTLNLTGMSDGQCQQRIVSGDYGLMFRQDGSQFYMLLTNKGDQYGTWNSLRPFAMNLSNGVITSIASATTNSLVTTSAISKATNGYVKLGNGIIIQWGRTGTYKVNATFTVTFPIAFSSFCCVVPSCIANVGNSNEVDTTLTAVTKTNFTVLLQRQSGSGDDGGPVNWIAVGY